MSCEYIEENFIHFFSMIIIASKKRADKNNSSHNTTHQQKKRGKNFFLRMLVVLKPIKCELEIAKGVRAKGEASVIERDVVFNAAEKLSLIHI